MIIILQRTYGGENCAFTQVVYLWSQNQGIGRHETRGLYPLKC